MAGDLVRVGGWHNQKGMTTAEYAVGTVATVSFVGIILAIINNPEFQKAIWQVVLAIIKVVMQTLGGGA
nr:DUF4244 domain-containing protein [Propionicimonas sp.]